MSNVKIQNLKGMNNKYVKNIRTIDVEAWLEDVYIDDSYKDCYMADEMNLLVIETNSSTFCALTPVGDKPDLITLTRDGHYIASSSTGCHQIDLEEGYVYTGDEDYCIGKTEPFETNSSWLSNCIVSFDFECELFTLSEATLDLVIDKYGHKFASEVDYKD